MQIQALVLDSKLRGSIKDYIEVIKPRETGLLVFIAVVTALIASAGSIPLPRLLFLLAAVLAASAGANGLTNYLDRNIDSRMERTRHRALPAGRVYPPERALYFTAGLSLVGLFLAWFVHPAAFAADIVGTAAALIYRKRVTCVFPQGMIASCAPVLMGWFAGSKGASPVLFWLCALIALWLPSHIWSVMLARRDEYLGAGITYFPVNASFAAVTGVLFATSWLLSGVALTVFFEAHFGWLYLVTAILSSIMIVYASWHLLRSQGGANAWKLYRLSAFPYLGVLFLAMGLDVILRR